MALELTCEGKIAPLQEDIKVLLFEAVRELLFNVVKHAGVATAKVSLCPLPDHPLRIVVSDTGVGFDLAQFKRAVASRSSFEDNEQAQAMREAGAVHYVPKSSPIGDLLTVIRNSKGPP